MSVFFAPRIIVFFLTIIARLPRDGYQYNYASSDGVKKVLDRDVNGDGKLDVAVSAQGLGISSVFLNATP